MAHDLVDIAINRALTLLVDSDYCDVSLDEYVVPADIKRRTPVKKASSEEQVESQPNVSWPTIEEFTPDLGTERIIEFIKVSVSLIFRCISPFTEIVCSVQCIRQIPCSHLSFCIYISATNRTLILLPTIDCWEYQTTFMDSETDCLSDFLYTPLFSFWFFFINVLFWSVD